MKNIIVATGLILFSCSFAVNTYADSYDVNCDKGQKVGDILKNVKYGDLVRVNGVCKESIFINSMTNGITIEGNGQAVFQGPPADTPPMRASDFTFFIMGKEITLKGLIIEGGSHGVHLSGPATVTLENNIIRKSGGAIHLDKGSIAAIYNNIIEDNNGYGINLIENSYARIGFKIPSLPELPGNIIRNNKGPGIIVSRWSSAWIASNTIENNQSHGVFVDRISHADIVANKINSNYGDAIHVVNGSGVNLDSKGSDMLINTANFTEKSKNQGFSISCSIGGYVAGSIGNLGSVKGKKTFTNGCVDNTN